MISLIHRATGQEIRTDEESVGFWKAAGYREPAQESKPAAKRSSSKSSK